MIDVRAEHGKILKPAPVARLVTGDVEHPARIARTFTVVGR